MGERRSVSHLRSFDLDRMVFYKHCIPRDFTEGTMSAILERPARQRDLVKAFEVALDKAREFKYELERMKVTFSVSDDACTAYFEVVPEPGHVVPGGILL